jgi:VCBS repeat-containing protein
VPYLLSRDGSEFLVNTTTQGNQSGKIVVPSADGGFVVIWNNGIGGDAGQAIKGQRFAADGSPIGGEFPVDAGTGGSPILSDAVTTADGGFLVVYTLSGDSLGQLLDASGNKVGSPFQLSASTAGSENDSSATILANGNYLFGWVEDNSTIQTRLFGSNGQPLGGDVSIAPGSGLDFVGLTGGRYVLAWRQGLDLKLQLFEANGTAVGDAFGIAHPADSTQGNPALLALPNGGFAVTWEYQISGNFTIYVQTFDAQGVATSPSTMVSLQQGQQNSPSISGLPGGGFLISWSDASGAFEDKSSFGIVAQAFNADGTESGTNFLVNTNTLGVEVAPSIATLDDGRVVIAWTGEDGNGSGIKAQIFEPSAGPDDIILSTASVSETAIENLEIGTLTSTGSVNGVDTVTYTYLSDSAGGAFRLEGNRLVVADNGRLDFEISPTVSVTLRATDEAGNSFDETIVLDVTDIAVEQRYAAANVEVVNILSNLEMATLPGGGFVLVGNTFDVPNSGQSFEVGAQIFDAVGNPVGAPVVVNTNRTGGQGDSQVATLSDGSLIVIWRDGSVVGADNSVSSIRGQRLDATGAKLGGEFIVNSTFNGEQTYPDVDALVGGGFVATWSDFSGLGGDAFAPSIKARLFDNAGVPLGSEFLVNTSALGLQFTPVVTSLPGGGFVIAWETTIVSGPDTGDSIRAQVFAANGSKVGGEITVTATTEFQSVDDIEALPGGGFILSYVVDGQRVGQIFDAGGAKVGAAFALPGGDITVLPSGQFVVTWASNVTGATQAQFFDSAGVAVGPAVRIDTPATPASVWDSAVLLPDGSIAIAWNTANDQSAVRLLDPVQPVTAQNDALATVENLDITGNLLANDLHDAFAVLRVGSINGQAASVGQIITLASGARLRVNADGTYLYDTNNAFDSLAGGATTTDSFTYGLTNGTSATVTVTITGVDPFTGDAGNNNFAGTAGDDFFFLQQGGNDSAFGQGGNDGFYFGAALNQFDVVDGGPGVDSLAIQGIYANLTPVGMNGIEVLLVLPGNDTRFGYLAGDPTNYAIVAFDGNVSAGATLTVQATTLRPGENLVFDGSAETNGNFRIFAGQGIDDLTGGAGSDGFFFGADGNLTGADRVDGGAGADSIALRGNYVGAAAILFQDASFTNVEVLALLSGHTNEFGGFIDTNGFDYDVTLADGTIAAGGRLDVIATNLRDNESARVDARAELDGSARILAGAGDDILFGSAGADILYGGLGADALDGSGGADTYVYRAVGESTAAASDTLAFGEGDRIDLALIDAVAGGSTNEAFTFIGDAAFSNVAGQLRSFQSGAQWIVEGDVDGDGIADLVIAVDSASPLIAGDFIL